MVAPERALDDADLLARARAGDAGAVAALYDAHLAAARRLAGMLVGPDAAEDLVSDGFVRVLAGIRSGRGPGDDFRSYLFATMRNQHRDVLRRGHPEDMASDRPWILEDARRAGRAVDSVLDEYDVDLAAAFATLPERWQRVLRLLVLEDRSVAEVAAELQISSTAVTSLAARARRGLRAAYLHRRGPAVAAREVS